MKESLYYLFLSGLILGSGPCMGFCAPILVSFISAYKASIKKSLFSYLAFSLARILSYMVLGALCGVFSGILKSSAFLSYLNIINIALGFFILGIGVLTVILKDPLTSRYCAFIFQGNLRNAGVLGILTGFAPCLPLLGVLNYIIIIANSAFQGLAYAFVFGLGTAISPLILLIALSGKLAGDFSKKERFKFLIKLTCGLVLIFLGLKIILQRLLH